MHTTQTLMLQVDGVKMTHLYFHSQERQVFYLHDIKLGEPWKIVQCIQHRGVFDV